MKRIIIKILMTSLIALHSTLVFADIQIPVGWYAEGNVGGSQITNASSLPSDLRNNGVGFNINLGYKFIPYMAAEFGGTKYAKMSQTYRTLTQKIEAEANYHSFHLAARAILPMIDTGFEFFAKLGVSLLHSGLKITTKSVVLPPFTPTRTVDNESRNAFNWFIGLGGQYYVTSTVPINIQWQKAGGDTGFGRASLYSIGIGFIMG